MTHNAIGAALAQHEHGRVSRQGREAVAEIAVANLGVRAGVGVVALGLAGGLMAIVREQDALGYVRERQYAQDRLTAAHISPGRARSRGRS